MTKARPSVVRFYVDADVMGMGIAGLRFDVTYPGDPGADRGHGAYLSRAERRADRHTARRSRPVAGACASSGQGGRVRDGDQDYVGISPFPISSSHHTTLRLTLSR